MPKLARDFYERPTLTIAGELPGKIFVFKNKSRISGRIVEVEAYIGRDDPACHARFGLTRRNSVMFGPGGVTYIYFIYGMYNMLNFVTEKAGFPAACLIRAIEPLEGLEIMYKNRGTDVRRNLTNGPGKLCTAFGLTTKHSGIDMTEDIIFLEDDGYKPGKIIRTERIGIRDGRDKKWRFFIEGNEFVSKR
ncbi:MAG TPA: DNA-3-methyladenine glycosylase [candidate division Zixibacteria bacterium]|nr:DNA-3-methyladenine glycosylase [candidate division Zixibacteria bacterium]